MAGHTQLVFATQAELVSVMLTDEVTDTQIKSQQERKIWSQPDTTDVPEISYRLRVTQIQTGVN